MWWLGRYAPAGLVAVTTFRSPTPLELRFRQSFTRYIGTVTGTDELSLNKYLTDLGYRR